MYLQSEKNARLHRQWAVLVTILIHVALVFALMTDFGTPQSAQTDSPRTFPKPSASLHP
jgi:hypothetical protein